LKPLKLLIQGLIQPALDIPPLAPMKVQADDAGSVRLIVHAADAAADAAANADDAADADAVVVVVTRRP
jgi:hypothetical protein